MKQITEFTADARQHHTIVTDGNETIDFTLYFAPRSQAWYFDLSYNNINLHGQQIVNGYRLLRQWKNFLPFDFTILSVDKIDPFQLSDFAMERTLVFLLNSTDIETIEKGIYYE